MSLHRESSRRQALCDVVKIARISRRCLIEKTRVQADNRGTAQEESPLPCGKDSEPDSCALNPRGLLDPGVRRLPKITFRSNLMIRAESVRGKRSLPLRASATAAETAQAADRKSTRL